MEVPPRAGPAKAREGEFVPRIALRDIPGRIDPKHEKRHPARARPIERGQPVRDLFDIGAIFAAEQVDRIAHLHRRAEELAIGHHDRPGGIVGKAHPKQLRDSLVGRGRLHHHPVEQPGEFRKRKLIGKRKGPVLGPKLRRKQKQPPLPVVVLGQIAEHRLRDHLRGDPPRILQPPPKRLRDRQRIAQRSPERLRRFLQLGVMVAVLLNIIAHPVFGRRQRPRIVRPLQRGHPVRLLHCSVEPGNRFGHRRRVMGQFDQLVTRNAKVLQSSVGEDLGQFVGTRLVPAG